MYTLTKIKRRIFKIPKHKKQHQYIFSVDIKIKLNDCVVCGAILHELVPKQCQTKPKVLGGRTGLPSSVV